MLKDYLKLVDGGDRHLNRLVEWVCLLLRCVTNSKDSHKVWLIRIMRYYVELQVLDMSIASYRLGMTTRCARSVLTVINYDRACKHFGPVRLERMTGPFTPMTWKNSSVNRTFLWWRHKVIRICMLRLTLKLVRCGHLLGHFWAIYNLVNKLKF